VKRSVILMIPLGRRALDKGTKPEPASTTKADPWGMQSEITRSEVVLPPKRFASLRAIGMEPRVP
jgi:hypothetical protein